MLVGGTGPGTVSAAKLPLIARLGATAIDYRHHDLGNAIRAERGGKGVDAAFDAIGGKNWKTRRA